MTDGDPIGQNHSQDEGYETPVVPVPSVPRNDRRLVIGALFIKPKPQIYVTYEL
jgi:hypothetical protein